MLIPLVGRQLCCRVPDQYVALMGQRLGSSFVHHAGGASSDDTQYDCTPA